ncbi:hypothetical protein WN943_024366 [Citrus x changshan-huyou]
MVVGGAGDDGWVCVMVAARLMAVGGGGGDDGWVVAAKRDGCRCWWCRWLGLCDGTLRDGGCQADGCRWWWVPMVGYAWWWVPMVVDREWL